MDEIADKVELRAWSLEEGITISGMKEELESLLPVRGRGSGAGAGELSQAVFDEFVTRKACLGSKYPFKIENSFFSLTSSKTSPYLFCVALCTLESLQIPDEVRKKPFEELVLDAAKSYIGGEGIRVGSPRNDATEVGFWKLMDQVSQLVIEIGEPTREPGHWPGQGDGGWDIIVVKHFADKEFPKLIAIGNCATGKFNWKDKGMESAPNGFWRFFQRPPYSPCLEIFATPFGISGKARFDKTYPFGLFLDRRRIAEHSDEISDQARDWLMDSRTVASDMALT